MDKLQTVYFSLIAFLYPAITSAAGLVPCAGVTPASGVTPEPMCDFAQLLILVQNVINYALILIVIISVASIMYAGFLYLTSAGNEGQVTRAHGIFVKVAFGLAIALGAWLIVSAIAGTFLDTSKLGSLWFLGSIKF